MQYQKQIACCLTAAALLLVISSCRRQTDFFQPDVICQRNSLPVTGPAVLFSAGMQQVNYDTAICGFMPMHNNAYWIYIDSFFKTDGTLDYTAQDTLSIKGIYKSPLSPSLFWRIASRNRKGINGMFYTTDSMLHAIDIAFSVPAYFEVYPWAGYRDAGYPRPRPIIADPRYTDTLFTMNAVSDMAYMEKVFTYKDIITVPSGSYKDCIAVHKFLNPASEQMIFKPGVGLVKFISYYPGSGVMFHYGAVKQVSVLTSYHLF